MKVPHSISVALFTIAMAGACLLPAPDQASVPIEPRAEAQLPARTSIPFAFKGTWVASSKTHEEPTDIAVKGQKWLIQLPGASSRRTIVNTGAVVYVVDHERRTYYVPDDREADLLGLKAIAPGEALTTGLFAWSTYMFFRPEALAQLETLDRTENLATFRRGTSGAKELITIDPNTGLIVKREFPERADWMEQGSFQTYKYEIRNLSYEVEDAVFDAPEGYRLITAAEAFATPARPL